MNDGWAASVPQGGNVMPDSIQKMNHFFIVDDNHGNMYRIGAQGEIPHIEKELKKASRNVRYVGSKEEDRVVRGRSRRSSSLTCTILVQ